MASPRRWLSLIRNGLGHWRTQRRRGAGTPLPDGAIDARELVARYTADELHAAADDYFRRADREFFFRKPFHDGEDTPRSLISFGAALQGLRALPGMRVLDFGCGTCWTSHILTQLRFRVVSMDISPTALEIGKELFERRPPSGFYYPPAFLSYDGGRFPLPAASVDRIFCFDAFHHVPDRNAIFREMARVLKPGGIAAFSEPGPRHSLTAASQHEMRHYTVVENDMDLAEIRREAMAAGFDAMHVSLFSREPLLVSFSDHETFVRKGGYPAAAYALDGMRQCGDSQLFFLRMKGDETVDSRTRASLGAEIAIRLSEGERGEGTRHGVATLHNRGTGVWLPSSESIGGVNLAIMLVNEAGAFIQRDYRRIALPVGDEGGVVPGATLTFEFSFPAPERGSGRLAFDLVAENVAWFSDIGATKVTISKL